MWFTKFFASINVLQVRRCSHDCLGKVFRSIQSAAVIKKASKGVLSMLKKYMPLAVGLSTKKARIGSKDDEPENLEVLHMLNVLKLTVPFLSTKVSAKVLSEVEKLLTPKFSALTRHTLKAVEACFGASRADLIVPEAEKIVALLSSYVALGKKNPSDTVMDAAILLKRSLEILRAAESSSYAKNLPLVCKSLAGTLLSLC